MKAQLGILFTYFTLQHFKVTFQIVLNYLIAKKLSLQYRFNQCCQCLCADLFKPIAVHFSGVDNFLCSQCYLVACGSLYREATVAFPLSISAFSLMSLYRLCLGSHVGKSLWVYLLTLLGHFISEKSPGSSGNCNLCTPSSTVLHKSQVQHIHLLGLGPQHSVLIIVVVCNGPSLLQKEVSLMKKRTTLFCVNKDKYFECSYGLIWYSKVVVVVTLKTCLCPVVSQVLQLFSSKWITPRGLRVAMIVKWELVLPGLN